MQQPPSPAAQRRAETLRSTLEPSDAELVENWNAVRSRLNSPSAQDRIRFNPIETVLSFALGIDALPARSGRTHLRKSQPAVKAIAGLFGRSTGSIQSKFGNLSGDPGRVGGQATDREVGQRLAADLELFEDLYRRILTAGYETGIDETQLPDFLGLTAGDLAVTNSASRVHSSELAEVVHNEVEELSISDPVVRAKTTELRITQARVGQTQFSRAVLKNYDYGCAFCGLSTREFTRPVRRFLIAGHVKPWSISSAYERLDPANGVAGCPTHDAAFEGGLLTVAEDRSIVRSQELSRLTLGSPGWRAAFQDVSARVRPGLDPKIEQRSRPYFDWHSSRVEDAVQALLDGTALP